MESNGMVRGLLASVAVLALIVSGCGGVPAPASMTPSPPPPTPVPTATPLATPTASPIGASERVLFTGTLDCGFPQGLEETVEGSVHTYTGVIECTYQASDPRASGTESGVITMRELDLSGYHVNKWFSREGSDVVLTNAGGSWRLTEAFGADQWDATGGAHTVATSAYVGEGGYSGLRMRLLYAQGTLEPVDSYILLGWIEPAP